MKIGVTEQSRVKVDGMFVRNGGHTQGSSSVLETSLRLLSSVQLHYSSKSDDAALRILFFVSECVLYKCSTKISRLTALFDWRPLWLRPFLLLRHLSKKATNFPSCEVKPNYLITLTEYTILPGAITSYLALLYLVIHFNGGITVERSRVKNIMDFTLNLDLTHA